MITTQPIMIRMDTKIPPIPFPMISRAIKKFSIIVFPSYKNLVTRLMTRPPAMTEAIWPDTLAPTACIRIIFPGSSFWAIFCTTLADMGNAEIPAAPIIGLIFSLRNRFNILANSTPPMVSNTKAIRPIPMIISVSTLTNASARMLKEIVIPSSRVIKLASPF